jgi:hemoglobin
LTPFIPSTKDDLIGPIFNGKIGNKWPEHLEKCTAFGKRFCSRNTLTQEVFLHINNYRLPKNILTAGWKFSLRTDELFAGATAEEAKLRQEYGRNVQLQN